MNLNWFCSILTYLTHVFIHYYRTSMLEKTCNNIVEKKKDYSKHQHEVYQLSENKW